MKNKEDLEFEAEILEVVYENSKDDPDPYHVEMAILYKREAVKIRNQIKEMVEKEITPNKGA